MFTGATRICIGRYAVLTLVEKPVRRIIELESNVRPAAVVVSPYGKGVVGALNL